MNVITIESEAFAALERKMDNILNIYLETLSNSLKENRLMSVSDVIQYTGFKSNWINERKADIGYFQDGKDLRFYKADVDAYFKKNFIKRK
jgi:hypothetical protein